jgi:hypothetical protein
MLVTTPMTTLGIWTTVWTCSREDNDDNEYHQADSKGDYKMQRAERCASSDGSVAAATEYLHEPTGGDYKSEKDEDGSNYK